MLGEPAIVYFIIWQVLLIFILTYAGVEPLRTQQVIDALEHERVAEKV